MYSVPDSNFTAQGGLLGTPGLRGMLSNAGVMPLEVLRERSGVLGEHSGYAQWARLKCSPSTPTALGERTDLFTPRPEHKGSEVTYFTSEWPPQPHICVFPICAILPSFDLVGVFHIVVQ